MGIHSDANMKILYFYQYFTTPEGAWSTRAYEFARRWAASGDTVTVVTSVYDKSDIRPRRMLDKLEYEDGLTVRVINVRLSNKHGFFHRLATFVIYTFFASWYALVLPADVVLCSSGPITVGLPGIVARYLRRRPFVFEVRDLWPEGSIQLGIVTNPILIWLARRFERLCYSSASRVVALSDGMRDWICLQYGCDHVQVVPNASDNGLAEASLASFSLPRWAKDKPLVVYSGSLGPMHDCGQIIDMAEKLMANEAHRPEVIIIGDGKERAQLEATARERGLSIVHFLGLRPRAEVFGWLGRASGALLVCKNLPCLETFSPNKLFDAFAAGVPVVQTSEGWIRDLFSEENCGLSVKPGSPEEFAGAVLRLVENEQLRTKLAENARRLGRERFDRDLLSTKMREILNAATGG